MKVFLILLTVALTGCVEELCGDEADRYQGYGEYILDTQTGRITPFQDMIACPELMKAPADMTNEELLEALYCRL